MWSIFSCEYSVCYQLLCMQGIGKGNDWIWCENVFCKSSENARKIIVPVFSSNEGLCGVIHLTF